jgi:phosphate starvation-inducible protein PhoH
MLEKNVIEVAPLAFMRGRTLNDAFIIMDEAQNTTIEQMKMFLTRMGNNSRAVITGDITQIDLPNPRKSGMLDAINVLKAWRASSFATSKTATWCGIRWCSALCARMTRQAATAGTSALWSERVKAQKGGGFWSFRPVAFSSQLPGAAGWPDRI